MLFLLWTRKRPLIGLTGHIYSRCSLNLDLVRNLSIGSKPFIINREPKIITNRQTSTAFPLSRLTRQGCPLSPGLFVTAIVPLAEIIRQDLEIKGLRVGQMVHKINLMADNIILYLTNPYDSLAKLKTILHTFSSVSGCKVNYNKSEILPLSNFHYEEPQQGTQFVWSSDGINYLGIRVDNNLENLYKLNYIPLVNRIIEYLQKWVHLLITMIGRINCFKMNALHCLQYLFQPLL